MNKIYYKAPPEKVFKEMQKVVIGIFEQYEYSDKPAYIRKMQNIRDNFMVLWALMDPINQRIAYKQLSKRTRKALIRRLKSGGNTMAVYALQLIEIEEYIN